MEKEIVALRIRGLSMESDEPVIVLEDRATDRRLRVPVSPFEASAILLEMEGISAPRPLTHDLLAEFFSEGGFSLDEASFFGDQESGIRARISYHKGIRRFAKEVRPSDALALSLRLSAPLQGRSRLPGQAAEALPAMASAEDPRPEGLEGQGPPRLGAVARDARLDRSGSCPYNPSMKILQRIKEWLARVFARESGGGSPQGRAPAGFRPFWPNCRPPYYQAQAKPRPARASPMPSTISIPSSGRSPSSPALRSPIPTSGSPSAISTTSSTAASPRPSRSASASSRTMACARGSRPRSRATRSSRPSSANSRTSSAPWTRLGSRAVNADLYEVERFIDLCRYDYERIIGLFDPSANIDDPALQARLRASSPASRSSRSWPTSIT